LEYFFNMADNENKENKENKENDVADTNISNNVQNNTISNTDSTNVQNTKPPTYNNNMNDQYNANNEPNATMNLIKDQMHDVKLMAKSMVGQIEESEDDPKISNAIQKLDTYKEQISLMVKAAECWAKAIHETWDAQQKFLHQINKYQLTIKTLKPANVVNNDKHNPNANINEGVDSNANINVNINNNNEQKIDSNTGKTSVENIPGVAPIVTVVPKIQSATSSTQVPNTNEDCQAFINVMNSISFELYTEQKDYEKYKTNAEKLLIIPLQNILKHEIKHAIDIRQKYLKFKRQYDDYRTVIAKTEEAIDAIDHPVVQEESKNSTTEKIKNILFGRVLFNAEYNKQELEVKLSAVRIKLPLCIKQFEEAKQQLLESIQIIEQKLNIEVVYYVQQFYNYIHE